MARKVDLVSQLDLKEAFKNTLESEELYVTDVRNRYKYDDGKRTDEVDGVTFTLQVANSDNNPLSFEEFEVQTDMKMSTPEELLGKKVDLKINDVRIWASSRRSSEYAEPRVTLRGEIAQSNYEA